LCRVPRRVVQWERAARLVPMPVPVAQDAPNAGHWRQRGRLGQLKLSAWPGPNPRFSGCPGARSAGFSAAESRNPSAGSTGDKQGSSGKGLFQKIERASCGAGTASSICGLTGRARLGAAPGRLYHSASKARPAPAGHHHIGKKYCRNDSGRRSFDGGPAVSQTVASMPASPKGREEASQRMGDRVPTKMSILSPCCRGKLRSFVRVSRNPAAIVDGVAP